ncbi:IS110 family transposase [Candidatus Bipolaricaulota bacterium]|nr:IS110 family transposase [Candidatus Bipolaricaulota bacterium]
MHCIGVDVSKQELVTFDGTKERIFPNTRGLAEFDRFLKRLTDALVVFEPTSTYSRRLETLCRTQRISCCQLNPRVIPHLRLVGKGRSKTDSTDAELLYRYGIERGRQEAAQLENDELAESIQARLACYRVAQKSRVAYQNVFEALSHDPATSDVLLDEIRAEIGELKHKEKRQVDAAQKLVKEDPETKERLELLLSIPGVGPITALTLLALFRKYGNANRSQIVALSGFDPIRIQSGTSVHGKSRISKRGNREVRRRLYEATLSAARYNPGIRAIYRRLKEGGKPEKVARTAAARKLLSIAHAIYRSGEPFREPNQEET